MHKLSEHNPHNYNGLSEALGMSVTDVFNDVEFNNNHNKITSDVVRGVSELKLATPARFKNLATPARFKNHKVIDKIIEYRLITSGPRYSIYLYRRKSFKLLAVLAIDQITRHLSIFYALPSVFVYYGQDQNIVLSEV